MTEASKSAAKLIDRLATEAKANKAPQSYSGFASACLPDGSIVAARAIARDEAGKKTVLTVRFEVNGAGISRAKLLAWLLARLATTGSAA